MRVDMNGADAAMRPLGMTGTVFPREDCTTCRRKETCSACRRAARRDAAPKEPVSSAPEAAVRRRRMRWAVMAAAVGTISLILPLCWEYLPDVLAWLGDPAQVRTFVAEHAIASRLVLFLINFVQVLLAFLPGEPVELASGYAFGFWEGTAMCLAASGAATCVIWWAVRRWGWRLIDLFFDRSLVERFSWLHNSRRMGLVMLCVFLVPGTPKDFLTYFAGLTGMGFGPVVLIATFGRIPSIVTSTVAASALGAGEVEMAVAAVAVSVLMLVAGAYLVRVVRKRSASRVSCEPDSTVNKR